MKDLFIYVLLLAAVCFFLLAIDKSPNADIQDAREYCHMVWAHKQNSHHGWPDFNHNYAQQCHQDGTLSMDYIKNR